MKKLLLISLILGGSNLFAQKQQDSILVKQLTTIDNTISEQTKKIDGLTKKLDSQHVQLITQSDEIVDLTNKLKIQNNTTLEQIQKIDVLTKKLGNQNYKISRQTKTISTLNEKGEILNTAIDSLSKLIQINSQDIVSNSKELGTKIQNTEKRADSQIAELDSNVEKNRLYWIIATLVTLLFGGLIYWLLGKRITSSKTDVETQIRNTKASLEEESVKLDSKLVEVLESQLKLQQETAKKQAVVSNEKEDHSLALKVADEIIRIQKNLSRMDEKTKGLKQLNSSVKRIQDNFASNGYELVDMIGKQYKEGLKATVNFVQDEDFNEGKRIITRIIKPQVNFKGTMIQTAQIEVTEA